MKLATDIIIQFKNIPFLNFSKGKMDIGLVSLKISGWIPNSLYVRFVLKLLFFFHFLLLCFNVIFKFNLIILLMYFFNKWKKYNQMIEN